MGDHEDQELEIVAAEDDPRRRLDLLVVHLLERAGQPTTRAEVHRWIALGRVRVDGQAGRRARSVPAGARLTIRRAPPLCSSAIPDPSVRLDVVHEDEHLLVVNKPAGMVVHPAKGHWTGTLVHGLLAHLHPETGERGAESAPLPSDPRDPEGHLRPGIVHRLDKDTSGLLVVAKTPAVREGLKALFATHDIERSYTAIVVGRAVQARYDTPHGRHPHSRTRFTSKLTPERRGARRAITSVEPSERLGGATLVRCRLETGRTHQIRVHLAEQAETPILGDRLYGPEPTSPDLRALANRLGRQALHASTLGFVHPATERSMRWQCPLPRDMQEALEELRGGATRAST
jgi:23S rRNA pseudouridine1911/1915/1917 synthase